MLRIVRTSLDPMLCCKIRARVSLMYETVVMVDSCCDG